jgi:SAM-dependent methyltransferase
LRPSSLLEQWWGFYTDGFGGSDREALQLILSSMNEEERARRVRIIQPDAVFSSVASVEPLAWALPYTPPALLVSFDDSTSLVGAAERAPSTIACPMRSSDRQMLRCLHAFTSHHLKAIQAADARYHPPAVFDTTEHAITTTEDSSSSSSSSSSRSAERAQEAGVVDEAARARNSSGMAGGGGVAKSSGAEIDLAGPDRPGGAEIDLAGRWLTPRPSSGRPMGGSPHKVMACPAALSRLADDVSNRLKKRPGRGRSFPTRLLSAAKELALHQAAVAREERLKVGLSADVGASVSPGSHGGEGKGVEDEEQEAAEAACATGSTWPLMPPALLAKHVLAIGTRLALGEGMSVLDVGATCGHALAILQARYRNKLRAMGVDGSKASLQYARRTCQGTFCVGDARQLSGLADESFDVAFTMDIMSQLTSTGDVCDVARELARVVRPGGRAMIVSVPKSSCATTHDASWDCPHCFWQLKSIDKNFWAACLSQPPASEGSGGGGAAGGAYRIEIVANTELFPSKPGSYCHREHYSVLIHKKSPASVFVFQQPKPKLAVLTVASTPPIGEYGKQKVHYLTELSIENKRQYCAQHGFELVVAQNLAHGRTARWDKVRPDDA